jgi:hypothetical protein
MPGLRSSVGVGVLAEALPVLAGFVQGVLPLADHFFSAQAWQ